MRRPEIPGDEGVPFDEGGESTVFEQEMVDVAEELVKKCPGLARLLLEMTQESKGVPFKPSLN